MTKEKALQATRLLEQIEALDMLKEELEDLLASEQFDGLPKGLYTELFQLVGHYYNETKDELDEL